MPLCNCVIRKVARKGFARSMRARLCVFPVTPHRSTVVLHFDNARRLVHPRGCHTRGDHPRGRGVHVPVGLSGRPTGGSLPAVATPGGRPWLRPRKSILGLFARFQRAISHHELSDGRGGWTEDFTLLLRGWGSSTLRRWKPLGSLFSAWTSKPRPAWGSSILGHPRRHHPRNPPFLLTPHCERSPSFQKAGQERGKSAFSEPSKNHDPCKLVPGAGLEPARRQAPRDFKSLQIASTHHH